MKATGIVRRIDDLGRIVIPREIRRKFSIKEGDPLEIFLDDNGIILQKYRPNEDINGAVDDLLGMINECSEDLGESKVADLQSCINGMRAILSNHE